jgi:hypothetical protein
MPVPVPTECNSIWYGIAIVSEAIALYPSWITQDGIVKTHRCHRYQAGYAQIEKGFA